MSTTDKATHDKARQAIASTVGGAILAASRIQLSYYLAVMDQLSGEALTPADTTRFIEQVASET